MFLGHLRRIINCHGIIIINININIIIIVVVVIIIIIIIIIMAVNCHVLHFVFFCFCFIENGSRPKPIVINDSRALLHMSVINIIYYLYISVNYLLKMAINSRKCL